MLNNIQIQIKGNVDQRFVDDALEDAVDNMAKSRDRVTRDVYAIISANGFNNQDADDFFQAMADVISYGDEQAYQQRVDLLQDNKAYYSLVDSSLEYAIAIFVVTDAGLSREVTEEEYRYFKQKQNEFQSSIVPHLPRASRSASNNQRPAPRDTRNTGREGRVYASDVRPTGRDNRATGSNYRPEASQRRDIRQGAPGGATAYAAAAPQEPARQRREREPYHDPVRRIRGEDVSVAAPIPNNVLPFGKVFNPKDDPMEPYAQHELRSSLIVNRSGERIIPLVDFGNTPEVAVKEIVENEPSIQEITNPVNMISEGYPSTESLQTLFRGTHDVTMVRVNQYGVRSVPTSVMPLLDGFHNFKSFDQWHEALTKLVEESYRLTSENDPNAWHLVHFNSVLNRDLTELFNQMLALIDDKGGKIDSFVDDYHRAGDNSNTVRYWLYSPGSEDVLKYFQTLESEFIRHNYGTLDEKEVARLQAEGVLDPDMVNTEENTFMYIRRRWLVVNYRGSILNENLQMAAGSVCGVDYNTTPDFYNACAKFVRARNTRLSMGNILLTDTSSVSILLLAGRRDGAAMRAIRIA